MAVINGAKSVDDVIRTVKSGFMSVMRLTWITSPLAMVIAQKYIPQEVSLLEKFFRLMKLKPVLALGAVLQPHQLRPRGRSLSYEIRTMAHVVR